MTMAFYSGTASSYTDLLNALTAACTANGYTFTSGILSKGSLYVRPYVSTTTVASAGPGLTLQGGTGVSAGALVNPSPCQSRIGSFGVGTLMVPDPTFPLDYNIFIFSNPDEVYLIIKYQLNRFMHLAFGMSSVAGASVWISGTVGLRYFAGGSPNITGITISPTSGGPSNNFSYPHACGFMWQTERVSNVLEAAVESIYLEFDSLGWTAGYTKSTPGHTCAVYSAYPLISRSPSAWSSTAVLIPIYITALRASTTRSIVADIRNARYVRIDNYEPEQILTLGAEKWKIFPFHKKDSSAGNRDGGSLADHSGTFGWALRYDGP